jgi:hypothetical protein
MACWWLRERPEPIHRLPGIGRDGRYYVAEHSAAELAGFVEQQRCLPHAERIALADDFLRLRACRHSLRRWETGRLVAVPADHDDPLLTACCPRDWTPAAAVVAAAMSRCDAHNRMSDLFFSSRLQKLIDGAHIEVRGPRRRLGDQAVRAITRPA